MSKRKKKKKAKKKAEDLIAALIAKKPKKVYTQSLHVQIPISMHEALRRMCKATGLTKTAIVLMALKPYLEDYL